MIADRSRRTIGALLTGAACLIGGASCRDSVEPELTPPPPGRVTRLELSPDTVRLAHLTDSATFIVRGFDANGRRTGGWVANLFVPGLSTILVTAPESLVVIQLEDPRPGYLRLDVRPVSIDAGPAPTPDSATLLIDPKVVGASLREFGPELAVGDSVSIEFYVYTEDSREAFLADTAWARPRYSTSDSTVVRVDDRGIVRAVAPGSTTVSVLVKDGARATRPVVVYRQLELGKRTVAILGESGNPYTLNRFSFGTDGHVVATQSSTDFRSGGPRARSAGPDATIRWMRAGPQSGRVAPAAAPGGGAYLSTAGDDSVLAISPTGELRWSVVASSLELSAAPPRIAELLAAPQGGVYVRLDSSLALLDEEGRIAWRARTPHQLWPGMAASHDRVFVGVDDSAPLRAFTARGLPLWTLDITAAMLLPTADGLLFVSSRTEPHLYCITPDGRIAWEQARSVVDWALGPDDELVLSEPASPGYRVRAVSRSTGETRWTSPSFRDPPTISVTADGTVLATAGRVLAIRDGSGEVFAASAAHAFGKTRLVDGRLVVLSAPILTSFVTTLVPYAGP